MNGLSIRDAATPIGILCLVGGCILLARCVAGCKPADDPGAYQRGAVLTLAKGVRAADAACASIARARRDAELARQCDFARDAAAVSLEAADDALDGDDPARSADVPCQMAAALTHASKLAELIERAGGKVPKALTQ